MTESQAETVVFVHGLYMPGWELSLQRRRVARHGFVTHQFRYPSLSKSVNENANNLAAYLGKLDVPKLHLVGHSLGGLVILRMFEQGIHLPPGRVVFMGSPVRGSRAAMDLARRPWGGLMLGKSGADGLTTMREPVWRQARELGLIIGTHAFSINPFHAWLPLPNDGLVAEDETRIERAKDKVSVYANHTGMLFSRELAEQVSMFLRTGSFAR
jgi:pimeloyl-ACP methyl ester carboxylesterase